MRHNEPVKLSGGRFNREAVGQNSYCSSFVTALVWPAAYLQALDGTDAVIGSSSENGKSLMAEPWGDASGLQFRQASPSDADAMIACRAADIEAGPADERMAAYLSANHHPQKALSPRAGFVVEFGGCVVAYAAGHITRRFGCEGELQYLYVKPEFRLVEIATELLRLMFEWFLAHGAQHICVNVADDNEAARHFYAKHSAVDLQAHWMHWPDIRRLERIRHSGGGA